MKKIIGIVGTNSKVSTNRMLLEYIQTQFFYKVDLEIVEIKDVPLWDYTDGTIPEIIKNIAEKIDKSDAVIIATPEYDHAPTSSLINFLAWISNDLKPLNKKPVMIVGASYGTLGSQRAQTILRQVLSAPEINARVLSDHFLLGHSKNAFDDIGDLKSRDKIMEMENIFDEFLDFMDIINSSKSDLINTHAFEQDKWGGVV